MKLVHRVVWMVVVGAVGVACAEGTSGVGSFGPDPENTTEPTEPDSVKIPNPTDSDSGSSSDDGGQTITPPPPPDSGTPPVDSGTPPVDSGTPPVDSGSGTCVTNAPSNLCGLHPQCGCASNQTCDITNKTNGYVSCILAGGGPLASLCTTSSQCAKGFTCAYGACRPFCGAKGAACANPGTNKCTELWEPGASAMVPNGLVCTIACDPRSPSAACGSNNCIWDPSVASTDCDKAGPVTAFNACAAYNDCAQGLACINSPFFGPECEPYCRVGHDEDCPFLTFCEDIYPAGAAPTSGGLKLGHCQ
jgi:hypothetical protein